MTGKPTKTTRVPEQASRLTREMLETAQDMDAFGIMDDASYRKIAPPDFDRAESAAPTPLAGKWIGALRGRRIRSDGAD